MADVAPSALGDSDTPPAQSAGEDRALLHADNYWVLIVGIMGASLLQVLDSTIANVAIPHMQTALGATRESITWVLTSYIIASAVALPITGWLADRIGGRRLFIWSVAGFIVTSMLCGTAQNLGEMVIFRAMQGVTGAFIGPLSQAFMLDTTRPSRHAQIMAIWGTGVIIGPILGPVLGGWLTQQASWRWVFLVNLPIGILSLASLIAFLPHRERIMRQFDIAGFVLLAMSLSALQLFLDRGTQLDWFNSGEIWLYLVIALAAGWMVVIHLATSSNPLFQTKLLADRNFAFALFFMAVIGLVMFAVMALMPPMLQNLFGYGVVDTGLVLMPRGVGVLISMQLSGWLVRKNIDTRPIVVCGFLICAISLWRMAHWSLDVDTSNVVEAGLLQGLGMGLVFIPLQASAFATLPPRFRTDGSSLLNLTRSLGASVGISMITAILGYNIQASHSDLAGHLTAATGNLIDISTIDRFQSAGDAALLAMNGEINRQAAMIAYIDDFYLMMWLSLAVAPLALLMRKSATPRETAG